MDIHEAVIRDLFRAVSGIVVPASRGTPARDVSSADRVPAKDKVLTEDRVEISAQARSLNAADVEFHQRVNAVQGRSPDGEEGSDEDSDSAKGDSSSDSDTNLTKEEREEVKELKERDREVRTHEQSHLAAAGPYARGGPTYEYQRGPDNGRYAVGGEVRIDTSKENSPEATVRKAQVIRRAASAPAEPSVQDRLVASKASKMEADALQELAEKKKEEVQGTSDQGDARALGEYGGLQGDLPKVGGAEDGDANAGLKESNEAADGKLPSISNLLKKQMAVRYLSTAMSTIVPREDGGMGSLVDMFA